MFGPDYRTALIRGMLPNRALQGGNPGMFAAALTAGTEWHRRLVGIPASERPAPASVVRGNAVWRP